FGTSGRVYRRAVKDLIEKGLITKTDNGLEIIDELALKAFIEAHE
ncbi:Crp/Fnr family transcriptional regulator, partial [Vibrio parahaemolyticus]|nr:Crp/Fnr family transcriptional regulator [Vibrio parahaemolyticus]NMV06761.1 Crp/Fnr family transcriptional regulator [Vibrio parahaemolyticus]